jgi:hypothetical protein
MSADEILDDRDPVAELRMRVAAMQRGTKGKRWELSPLVPLKRWEVAADWLLGAGSRPQSTTVQEWYAALHPSDKEIVHSFLRELDEAPR